MSLKMVLRRLAWAALVLLVLMALAWWLVPMVAKSQLEQRGSALLGRAVGVESVSFAPWALSLTLNGLTVAGAPGDRDASPQLAIGRLFIDASLRTLLERAPVLEAFEIDAPRLRLARLAPGRYDVDDIVQHLRAARAAQPPANDEPPARFAVFNVQLRGGEFLFDDRAVDSRTDVRGLTLALPFLSNLPADITVRVEPRLAAVVDGSTLDLQGQTLPFSPDRASELRLKWAALPLARWWAYLPGGVPLRPAGGVLDSDLVLRFAQPAGAAASLALSGSIAVGDLAIATPEGQPLLGWRRLAVGLADVRPLERKVALSSFEVDGLAADVRRDAAGRLQWQTLFARPGTAAAAPADVRAPTPVPTPAPTPAPASAVSAPPASAAPAPWQFSLARLSIADAALRWRDASTQPAAALDLRPLQVQAESLTWPDATASPLKASLQLNAGPQADQPAGRLGVTGTLSSQAAALALDLAEVQLSAAGPYLQALLKPRLDGRLDAAASIDWAGGATPRLALSITTLRLNGLALTEAAAGTAPRAAEPPVRVAAVEVDNARVDVPTRQVVVGALRVRDPALRLSRTADGAWNAAQWRVAPESGPAATAGAEPPAAAGNPPAAGASPPWRTELKDFRLSGGRLQFDDAAAGSRPLSVALRSVQVGLRGLSLPAGPTPADFDVSVLWPDAALASAAPGRLQARGRLALAPFGVRSAIDAERLPLHVIEPYVAAQVPVLLRRAELGYKGDVELRLGADGPAVAVLGDVLLADLRVQSRVAAARPGSVASAGAATGVADGEEGGEELLSWQSLTLRPLSVRLQPGSRPAVEIGEAVLSDFFSRLIITEQGRFNLRDVQGDAAAARQGGPVAAAPAGSASAPAAGAAAAAGAEPLTNAPASAGSATAAAAAGSATAAAPAGSATAAAAAGSGPSTIAAAPVAAASVPASGAAAGKGVDVTVGTTRLVGGRVDFTDRFIRPNYSAQLTELSGSLGRFSSGSREMATLDLRGRAAGTALLEIRGALNPTVDPLALDISARVTDLELAPLSPYASKYAGYAIERGKLSLDIAYRIDPDGKLAARNQLVLNQLTFGERVEGPNVTKLPVRLALALLTDRNGVIDVNLPISGSINDPQFSVFSLVLQVIGNLIVKAITAPFSLLAGGGGEDLSQIEFMPGTTTIAAVSAPTLERVAKALTDRPALRLTVTGAADADREAQAMQVAAMDVRLQTEQRRELARAGTAASADAVLPPLSVADRTRLVELIYSETRLPNKPRNLVGLAKALPLEEMEALLKQATVVSDDSARELALQRGLAVRDALIGKGLPAERLFLGAPKLGPGDDQAAPWQPRVLLSLSAP